MRHLAIAGVLLLSALARADDKSQLHVEYTKSISFSRYKTFAWAPFQQNAASEAHHVRIEHAVEEELLGKGFTKAATSQGADLLVEYKEALEKKVEGTPSRVDSPWQPTNPQFIVDFSRVEIGTLILEFWDPGQKDIVWQGKESRRMGSGDEVDQQINDLVHEILGGFPPKPPKAAGH